MHNGDIVYMHGHIFKVVLGHDTNKVTKTLHKKYKINVYTYSFVKRDVMDAFIVS